MSSLDALVEAGRRQLIARDFAQAEAIFRQVLARAPNDHRALRFLGQIAHQRGAYEQARGLHERAVKLAGGRKEYLVDLGLALTHVGRLDEAEAMHRRALAVDPRFVPALVNLGRIRALRGDHERAVELFERARAIDPAPIVIIRNLAAARTELGQLEEAEALLREAIARAPDQSGLWHVLGHTLSRLARPAEACAAVARALELDPGDRQAHSNLLFFEHYLDTTSPAEMFAHHRRYGECFPPKAARGPTPARSERLRIGYVSPDFNDHAVARFIGPVLAHHDRDRVEVFAYHCGPRRDATSDILRARADHWREIGHLPADQAVATIADDRIDLLVDLAGHTGHNRLGVFAEAPAAKQATWIGYPDTTGVPAIDFRITDAIADPPGAEAFHSEKLIRLPGCFLVYEPHDVAPVTQVTRDHIAIGSFNNAAKISDRALRLWAAMLDRIPRARLVLKAMAFAYPSALTHLRARAIAAGIDPRRMDLLAPAPERSDHLAQYALLDIALDTLPYDGTTTTCEALWMGVPVVTLRGDRHCARVGASLLTTVGLPELIADDEEAYVALVAELAQDPARLGALRAGLRERMAASPLCDARGFTRRLEDAFLAL